MPQKLDDDFLNWSARYLEQQWVERGSPPDLYREFCNYAEKCESPIERKMLAGLMFCPFGFLSWPARLAEHKQVTPAFVASADSAVIVPQAQVAKLKWRVDFAVFLPTYGEEVVAFVIECDGHDFHERTKEQAARDRKRDRDLQTLSIPILRFTGSEIFRNLDDCIGQIDVFGANLIEKVMMAR